jgi:hypothetical protein
MYQHDNNLNNLQKSLNEDVEVQSNFLHAEVESDCSESDSEQESCKIILPKRKKNTDTSQEMLHQLLLQHKMLSKTQKKMYKLQSEIDSEEVSTRYIKLELNNTQVILEETKLKFKDCKMILEVSRTENWITRIFLVLYMFYRFYCLFD